MFQNSIQWVISLILFAIPVFTKAQVDYKIDNEFSPENITQKISLVNKEGLVLKEWSNKFSRICRPSKGDSLFVAEVGINNIFVCLDTCLEIRFVFPLNCKATGFENGYSIISRGIENEGAVNREGEVIFPPEHEFVYTRDDGCVVAGDKIRNTGEYYKFTIKDQSGNLIGSFMFCMPRYMDHLLEVSIHDSILNCLVKGDFDYYEAIDETDRLFIKALHNHLIGNYNESINDYERVLQKDDHVLLQESALYNYLACRCIIGLENDYEQHKWAEYIKYAVIDGLFGKELQDTLLEEEQNNLLKNGFGVIFPDIKPSLYSDSLKYTYIPFICFDNKVVYESLSGKRTREIEDTHYSIFKDRIYFDGCPSNGVLAETILKEKSDFVLRNSPEDWQNSQNLLYVSLTLPNSINIEVIGDDQLELPRAYSRYITDIVEFMQRSCQEHKLKRLVLVFPLPTTP